MYKIRSFPESNYRSIYLNGKTVRQTYNHKMPITDLEYPEFYDVKITNKCDGKCPWCYQDSTSGSENFDNIIDKTIKYFGFMTENQKPFQVAIGGGEPTIHPDFSELLETFHELDITPNYTTNGMNLDYDIIHNTSKYCGGVAISCHEHLDEYWKDAISTLIEECREDLKINLHIIISGVKSINRFENIYNKYKDMIDYFVLLPHTAKGRAEEKVLEHEYLFSLVERLNTKKIAFGALFHPYLIGNKKRFDLSLYEPEIMSKYISYEGNGLMYKSSFCNAPIKENLF